jgi:hypothetical protein
VSIQGLQQNPQDTSNFYLANIYQTLADPNPFNVSSFLPTSPPPFSPPNYAVVVNALWFLSLVISLTCALLATLLQQWARRYLKVTHSRYCPHKRARIRAFFSEGVEKLLLPWTVETLPILLHISLFLFFSGLVVFLWNVNMTIFKLVLSWVSFCTALYGCVTLMPILRHDSPYYTSLSSSVWFIVIGIRCVISQVYWWFHLSVKHRRPFFQRYLGPWYRFFSQGMQKTVEETALKSPPEIDIRAFMWTLDSLDEDHELERFFSGLPGFRSSKVIDDPLPKLTEDQRWKLGTAFVGLLGSTFSSDLLPAHVKKRRAMLCAKLTDPAHNPMAFHILDNVVSNYGDSDLLAAEILQIVKGWSNDGNEKTMLVSQATVSSIIARAQRRDHPWFNLASNELGVPESVLRGYATQGDSLSLAVLIHITRQQYSLFWDKACVWSRFSEVLDAAARFNVRNSSPKLQHEFCTLWNQVVFRAQHDNDPTIAGYILRRIRNVYVALHQGTNCAPRQFSSSTGDQDRILWLPSSYPLCNAPGNHLNSTTRTHGISTSTAIARAAHDNSTVVTPPLPSTAGAPSLSFPTPLHFDKKLRDVPLPDDNISIPASFQTGHETTTERLRNLTTSPGPAADSGAPDIDTFARTPPPATLETSPFPTSDHSTSANSLQSNKAVLAYSDSAKIPSSASPEPAHDNIMPTGSSRSLISNDRS